MIIGSISENVNIEKRISITPEIAKKYISLGIEVQLSESYGKHIGYKNTDYESLGVKLLNDDKKIMGIITESSLLEVVSRTSFKETVKNNITKVKKIDYQFDLKKIVKLIMKEKYLFVYKNNFFYGVINKTDILWYLKKKENNA